MYTMFLFYLKQFFTLNSTLNENRLKNVYFHKPGKNLKNLEKKLKK